MTNPYEAPIVASLVEPERKHALIPRADVFGYCTLWFIIESIVGCSGHWFSEVLIEHNRQRELYEQRQTEDRDGDNY